MDKERNRKFLTVPEIIYYIKNKSERLEEGKIYGNAR